MDKLLDKNLLAKIIALGLEKGKETLFAYVFGDLEPQVKNLKELGFEEHCVITIHERDI